MSRIRTILKNNFLRFGEKLFYFITFPVTTSEKQQSNLRSVRDLTPQSPVLAERSLL